MKILFILDPLKQLNVHYDSSLAMIRTFTRRGHSCFFAEASDLFADSDRVQAVCGRMIPKRNSLFFDIGTKKTTSLKFFHAVLVRKEPPFNMAYIYMTYLLDLAAKDTLILNPPSALRDANEKLSTLEFPTLIPSTRVSGEAATLLGFQKKLKKDLILKPLDERGGRGICVLKKSSSHKLKLRQIQALTGRGKTPILAQEFISKPNIRADKRIFLLEGKFLAAYERRFAKGDFRGNLSQGASHHPTSLTAEEKKVLKAVTPWLKHKKLHFVGLDLLGGKLLEMNVTCPGGFPEADQLYPRLKVFEKFAYSVEKLAEKKRL